MNRKTWFQISRRGLRIFLIAALTMAVLGSAVFLLLWNWYLPEMLEGEYLPRLQRELKLARLELKLRRLGLKGIDAENFVMEDARGGQLTVESLRVDFSPKWPEQELPYARIQKITLTNIRASIAWTPAGVKIDGFDLTHLLSVLGKSATPTAEKNADDYRKWKSRICTVKEIALENLRLTLVSGGFSRTVLLNMQIRALDDSYEKMEIAFDGLDDSGKINGRLLVNTVQKTLAVKLSGNIRPERLIAASGLRPVSQAEFELDSSVQLDDSGDIRATGGSKLRLLPRKSGKDSWNFDSIIDLKQTFDCRYRLADRGLFLIGTGKATLPELTFLAGSVRLRHAGVAAWNFGGVMDGKRNFSLSELDFSLDDIRLEAFGNYATAPKLRINRSGGELVLNVSGISAEIPRAQLALSRGECFLPLKMTEKNPGFLQFNTIRCHGQELGAFDGTFRNDENGAFLFDGGVKTVLLPNRRIHLSGGLPDFAIGGNQWYLDAALEPGKTAITPELKKLIPALDKINFSGVFGFGASLRSANGELRSGAQIMVESGNVSIPALNTELKGVEVGLTFDDLFRLTTISGQKLNIASLKSGKIELNDFKLMFQIESPERALLQSCEFKWCDGELFLRPLALRLNQRRWHLIWYCENIRLAQLITQLGIANAVGDGVVSGKIPMSVSSRGIEFEPGQLYSLPGKTSVIKIADAAAMGGGTAGAVMEQTQMDFAGEALKNFVCNWVRVNLSGEGGVLNARLDFDGQPSGPLPFDYDSESGKLVRNGQSKAHFQGIQLNINTKIPLNSLLKFNERIQKL